MNQIYEMYGSDMSVRMCRREFYEDRNGFPNSNAFDDFSEKLKDSKEEYYLACVNIDLRKSNVVSYAFGSYVLRKFILKLRNYFENDCYIFRIQGEKFNIFIKKESMSELRKIADNNYDALAVYCGITQTPYSADKKDELIQQGIELMYQDKAKKSVSHKSKTTLIGKKGNTPSELQETAVKKYRSTMWYSKVHIKITEPVFQEAEVYVYPTVLCKPLETIPVIAVFDDMLNYRVYYGKDIQLGIEGVIFKISARFDREGHLNTTVFNISGGECECSVETIEGICIPANFGKRVGNEEIYPIKKNVQGLCDFVCFDSSNGKAEINTKGIVCMNGQNYGVHMDETCIDLIKE